MRIVSYNLREHAARGELADLVAQHDMDVLCLQECDHTDMPATLGGLALVEQTRGNRLGLAMYCREGRYAVKTTKLFTLRKSLHDRLWAPAKERLLAAHLEDTVTGQELLVGDFHAAPLTATNALRRKQIHAAHEGLLALAPGVPAVMVGDFNYPLFQRGLQRTLRPTGFEVTRTPAPTYLRYKIVSGYFDFATSTGVRIDEMDVLPQGVSDHLPISFRARFAAA